MPAQYATRNRTVLVKVETTSGTDANPVPATDAVKLENVSWPNGFETIQTNEFTSSLDRAAGIPGGGVQRITAGGILKGSGTAGTPPELDAMLQACGMTPTIVAAPITATARGGTSTTLQLAVGASSVIDYHVGMQVTITAGTGSGQSRIVVAYDPTSKNITVDYPWTVTPDATSVYNFPAAVRYAPISTGVKTVTMYDYAHRLDGGLSRLKKAFGIASAFTISGENKQPARIAFDMTGAPQVDTDVTKPAVATFQAVTGSPLMNVGVRLGGAIGRLASFELGSGAVVGAAPDMTALYGSGEGGLVDRSFGGNIRLPDELLSTRDFLANWSSGVQVPLSILWGPTVSPTGKRVMVTIPRLQYGPPERGDTEGYIFQQVSFRALGEDNGAFLTFF